MRCKFGSVSATEGGVSRQNCSSVCGDGWRSPLEECDDGNVDDGDGCDASCALEEGSLTSNWGCEGVPSRGGVGAGGAQGNTSAAFNTTYPTPEAADAASQWCKRDVCKRVNGVSVGAAQATAAAASTAVAAVIGAAVAGAVAGAVGGGAAGSAGAGAGGGGGATGAGLGPLFSMVNQVQFMAICGRAGGQNASVSNRAFSEGMDWINFSPPFEIVGGGGKRGRRAAESACDVSKCGICVGKELVEKLISCFSALLLIFIQRWLCSALFRWYKEEVNAPDDMRYPCWEGPVLIVQLFGLCDVSVKVMQSRCSQWKLFGIIVLSAPVGLLIFAFYRCWLLHAEGTFEFVRPPHRSVKQIYEDAWQIKGTHRFGPVVATAMVVYTFLNDLHAQRFRGDWEKHSEEAKFWGFLLSDTGSQWFCGFFPLLKKVLTAISVNVPTPNINAAMMLAIHWGDAALGFLFPPTRDDVVNISNSASALCNCAALLVATFPHIAPKHWVPAWMSGPYVILLTMLSSGISAGVALMGPASSVGAGVGALVTRLPSALSMVRVCVCVFVVNVCVGACVLAFKPEGKY